MFVEMILKFSNPCSHEEKTRDEVCIATNVQRKFPAGCSVKNIFWRRIPPHYNTIQVAYAVSHSRLRLLAHVHRRKFFLHLCPVKNHVT